jgi:hypothetical protein
MAEEGECGVGFSTKMVSGFRVFARNDKKKGHDKKKDGMTRGKME